MKKNNPIQKKKKKPEVDPQTLKKKKKVQGKNGGHGTNGKSTLKFSKMIL